MTLTAAGNDSGPCSSHLTDAVAGNGDRCQSAAAKHFGNADLYREQRRLRHLGQIVAALTVLAGQLRLEGVIRVS